jgi:hypothetical protein
LQKRTRSILDELDGLISTKDKENLIESRASSVMISAINLINYIRENYDDESAQDLEKRLLNSIRSQDPQKFIRGIRKMRNNENK